MTRLDKPHGKSRPHKAVRTKELPPAVFLLLLPFQRDFGRGADFGYKEIFQALQQIPKEIAQKQEHKGSQQQCAIWDEAEGCRRPFPGNFC